MSEDPQEPSRKAPRQHPMAMALSIGTELVVAVLLGVFSGRWADAKLGTQPVFLLIGSVLGISVGLYLLIQRTKLPEKGRSQRD